MAETHNMLQRMRELVVQSNNDTNTVDDLAEIQKEIDELNGEITRIASKTEFNTKTLLDGTLGVKPTDASIADWTTAGISVALSGIAEGKTIDIDVTTTSGSEAMTVTLDGVEQTIDLADTVSAGTTVNFDAIGIKFTFSADVAIGSVPTTNIVTEGTQTKFQIGANQDTVLNIGIGDMRADALGTAGLTITEDFDTNIATIDTAISKVSNQRSELGAWQNRLEYTIKNLDASAENLQAAESRIRDVDMAREMMEFTKNNILQQAATAMLAQANMLPQSVLQLLG